MLRDNKGNLSETKIMTFIGFFAFLAITVYVLYSIPDKFNYELFALLSGGGAVGTRIIDKYLNIKGSK